MFARYIITVMFTNFIFISLVVDYSIKFILVMLIIVNDIYWLNYIHVVHPNPSNPGIV